jgi:uncharacterized protein YxjI
MTETPAGWYPDPSARFEQRFWDGAAWTAHVVSAGTQSVDPMQPNAAPPVRVSTPEKVRRQVEKQAGIAPFAGGGGTLFDSPVLVVNQKAKLIELTNEYAVYSADGSQLGSVVEVGQGMARKALRLLTQVDQFLTHRLEVRDAQGRVALALTRPGKVFKSRVVVSAPDGREIGQIRQENMIGKIRFAFEVGGQRVGGVQAENWRAWNFAITDAQGGEVARIKKTFEGLAKAMFTTADNYVVRIHRPLEEPLRSLVVAAAVSVDTALKQDDR